MLPRWYDVVVDSAGNSLAGATVAVTTWKGGLATLYDIRDGSHQISSTLTTDARGQFWFYAASGHYVLTTTVAGRPVDVREITLGTGAEFNPEFFGILPGASNNITSAVQAWIDELIGASHAAFPSGTVQAGVIELPWLDNAVIGSLTSHPAISIVGNVRGGTRLKLDANVQTAAGSDKPYMLTIVARARSNIATPAWMPVIANLVVDGNSAQQSNIAVGCIYCEPVANDHSPGGGFGPIGYSAFLGSNCDVHGFSGHGVEVGLGRQRLTVTDRFRSTGHGIYTDSDGVVTLANGFKLNGNQPVLVGIGAGENTGHALLGSGISGTLLTNSNLWGPDGPARSNNGVAMLLFQCNGFSVQANVFNDTVVIDSSTESDRSSEFSGNQMKPNDPVFTADGVTVGTGDEQHNCHVLIRKSKNMNVGPNGYGAGGSTGYRYLDILHVDAGANVAASFSSTSFYDVGAGLAVQPWSSGRDVPIFVYSLDQGTTCIYDFVDVNRSAEWNNSVKGGNEGDNLFYDVKTAPAANPYVIEPTEQDTFVKYTGTVDVLNFELPYPPVANARYTVTTHNQLTSVSLVLTADAVTDGETIEVAAQPGALAAGESFAVIFRPSVKQWWPAP